MAKKGKGKGKGKKGGKKGGGTKTPTMVDGISAEEMTPEQLIEHIGRIKEELEREREERNFFQLERDKIHTFWEITRRQLEERKAEIRNKDREMEEAEERHQVEIKVYKQKAKQLLWEHQNASAELRMNSTTALKRAAEEVTNHEKVIRDEKNELKIELRTVELSHQDHVMQLTTAHDQKVTEMRETFERRSDEIVSKFEKKMREERDILELRRKTEIHEIEERKNGQIHALMKNHEKQFSDIKNYYNDITLNNLALINSLKQQIEEMKKKEDRLEKAMAEVMSQNRKLTEPLEKAREINDELRRKLENYEKDKKSLKRSKYRLVIQEKEMKDLKWENEVLEQRFKKLEAERDNLHKNFVSAVQEVVQKANFKKLLLERKVVALADSLEKKDAQLNEILAASNLDPAALSVVTRKLEDVLDAKNGAIKDLQYELARVCKAHNDLLRTYEAKLTAFGVPVDEVGFKPLESTVTGQEIGKGPAGLVSAPT
jgi:myosin heavy subunit